MANEDSHAKPITPASPSQQQNLESHADVILRQSKRCEHSPMRVCQQAMSSMPVLSDRRPAYIHTQLRK